MFLYHLVFYIALIELWSILFIIGSKYPKYICKHQSNMHQIPQIHIYMHCGVPLGVIKKPQGIMFTNSAYIWWYIAVYTYIYSNIKSN